MSGLLVSTLFAGALASGGVDQALLGRWVLAENPYHSQISIAFSESSVDARVGCTSYSQPYTAAQGALWYSEGLEMEAPCSPSDPPAARQYWRELKSLLQHTTRYSITKGHLLLATPEGKELRFKRPVTPSQ